MKIEINLMNDLEQTIARAIETDVRTLIINGVEVIRNGDIQTEMRQLGRDETEERFQPRLLD